jgi:hypothetical protein
VQPGTEREQCDDQLRCIPECNVQESADARTRASRKLLRGAPHEGGSRDDTKRGRGKDRHRVCMDELQHNRDRDQRHEQIRPTFPDNKKERFVAASGVCVVNLGSSRLNLGNNHGEDIRS